MRILNPIDAISPAIARTKLVLFTPFRWGRTWKLSVTSYLGLAGTLFFPFPLVYLAFLGMLPATAGRWILPLVIGAVLLGTVLFAFLFYLCSRLQFSFFDIVLRREQFVAPGWRKYGSRAFPWTMAKMGAGTLTVLVLAAPLVAYLHHLISLFERLKTLGPQEPPPPELMFAMFGGYGLVYVGGGALFLLLSTVNAFVLPSLALEDVTVQEALRRFFLLVKREPGQLLGYVCMKTVLGMVGYMGSSFLLEIALLVIAVPIVLIGVMLGFALKAAGMQGPVLIGLGITAGALVYGFLIVYVFPICIGPVFTFLQAYTLYFLGGRYPMVGEALEASDPPPPPPIGYAYAEPPAPPLA